MTIATSYPHYFKPTPFAAVDVYRVLALWEVNHPALAHAAKKVLCAGQRGTKAWRKDIEEARDSLQRALDMDAEDLAALRVADDGKGVMSPLDLLRHAGIAREAVLANWPKVDTPAALDKAYADAARTGEGWVTMGVDLAGDRPAIAAFEVKPVRTPAAVGVGTAEHKAAQEAQNVQATKAIDARTGGIAGFHGRYLASLAATKQLPMHTFVERVIECLHAKAKAVLHDHGATLSVDGFKLTPAQREAVEREMKRRRCTWSFQ